MILGSKNQHFYKLFGLQYQHKKLLFHCHDLLQPFSRDSIERNRFQFNIIQNLLLHLAHYISHLEFSAYL